MKCSICRNSIQETFLKKIVGTHVKDKFGKNHQICNNCQKGLNKSEILGKL